MNLLAIIFIACVSISTALPVVDEATSSALPVVDETTYTCQEGYELDGVNCRQLIDRIPGCPYGAVGSNDGDRCVVDNKFCSFGHPNTQATVDDRTERECDEGYTFVTAANRCVKRVDHGSPKAFCKRPHAFSYGYKGEEVLMRDGQCIALANKSEVCPKDQAVSSNPDCFPRRMKKNRCGCKRYYKIDPTDAKYCIFIEGSPERFCSRISTEDLITDRCRVDVKLGFSSFGSFEVLVKSGCEKGAKVFGRCEEEFINLANVFCPLESSTQNTKVTELPLSCFEGTVKESRCLVTRNVQPELVCPAGSSASSINPTQCKSDVAIPADVITATTTTITFADVAADVGSGL